MFFTVANHNDKYQSKGFVNYDGIEFENIPEIVTSGCAYASAKFKDNHRLDANYEGYEDILILDIDEDVNIEQAREIFSKYENFIITSKSHQVEKNNIICDRYRVFIRLSETLVDNETRKIFIDSVFSSFSFIDSKCKNPSRFYYASPKDALVFYNEGKPMPVIKHESSFKSVADGVEELKKENTTHSISSDYFCFNELTDRWENKYGDILEGEGGGVESKLKGAITILDDEFYSGNRNHCLFKVACMLLKDRLSEDEVANFIIKENDERDGMKLSEVMSCLKSAMRTI